MSPIAPDFGGCPHCREPRRFPEGWRREGRPDSTEIGAWTRAEPFGLWRCESCGALWSARYDQYSSDYECEPVPEPLAKLLRPLAKPGEVLQLLHAPSLAWLIEAYFRQAGYDLAEAAGSIVEAMAREPLSEIQSLRLLQGLSEVFRRAEAAATGDVRDAPLLRLKDVRPLVRLIERERLARDEAGDSTSRIAMRERTRAILAVLLSRARPAVYIDAASRHRLSRLSGMRAEPLSDARSSPPPAAAIGDSAEALQRALQRLEREGRIDRGGPTPAPGQAPARPQTPPSPPPALAAAPTTHAAERGRPAPACAALVAGSALLVSMGGFLLGEFLIPAGAFLLSALLFAGLLLAFIVIAFFCTACGRRAGVALGCGVMLGSLLLGHYLAYAWEGEEWAARYFAQRSGEAASAPDWRTLPRRRLLERMIAERLGEPAAGGPLDLLRLRAKVGSSMLVSARWGFLPDRGRRIGWEMWTTWIAQLAFALAAAAVVCRLIPRDRE